MSDNFEFWDEQLNKEYDKASQMISKVFKDMYLSSDDAGLIVFGPPNSGKTEFITHIIETQFFAYEERMKKVDKIIKLYYEDFIKVDKLKENKKSRIQKISEFIDPSISISLGLTGVSIDLGLEKIISKLISNNKKVNIVWIENVSKDTDISLEQTAKIIKENQDKNNFYVISTITSEVINSLITLFPNIKILTMPVIDQKWYKKNLSSPPNKKAFPNSLFFKIQGNEKWNDLIKMSDGAYGTLKLLLENQTVFTDLKWRKNILLTLFLNQFKEINGVQDELKLRLLLQLFLSSNEGPNSTWLENLFPDFSFDYLKYVENWEERGLLYKSESQKRYQINPFFKKYKESYLNEFGNKSLSRNLAKRIDLFLKQDSPEKYNLRYMNAESFDKELFIEYYFIFLLRQANPKKADNFEDVFLSDSQINLLRILNTPIKNLNDSLKDELLEKLNEAKVGHLPLLIYAEYAYFRLQILLSFSYSKRDRIRNRTELQIHRLIRTFDDLIDYEEDEMAIKIGLLISSQIINYLPKQDHFEAIRIYKCITEKIYKRKKTNYQYYKRYDIVSKFLSTSIINYRQASYNLQSVLESLNKKTYNYEELMPLVFCNLLGITLFIDRQSIRNLMDFYSDHKDILSYAKIKDYKILNNLTLAKACLDNEKVMKEADKYLYIFEKIKDKDVSAINYAGFLFYTKQYKQSESILKEILDKEKYDDFYQFYCKYNLCLVELLVDLNANRESIFNKLEYLEVPALFCDESIENELKKRVNILKKIVSKTDNKFETPNDIDNAFKKYSISKIPLLEFSWNFSDYQHWS